MMRDLRATLSILLLISLVVTAGAAAGSAPVAEWERLHGHYDETGAFGVAATDDGGFILVGETVHPRDRDHSAPSAFYQAYMVRVDASGDLVWERTIEDKRTRSLQAIVRTRNGTYAVAGAASSPPEHDADVYLAEIDRSGSILWERTYGGDRYDAASDLQEVEGGGFIVAGRTTNPDPVGTSAVYLVRTDGAGDLLWERTVGDGSANGARSVRVTDDGEFVIAGQGGIGLLKTDGSGTEVWNVSFREPSTFESAEVTTPNAVRAAPGGGYILAGSTLAKDGETFSFYASLMKTDADGTLQWRRDYPGDGSSAFYAVEPAKGGGFVAVGYTSSPSPAGQPVPAGESRIYLVGTDGSGNTLWETSLGESRYAEGRSVLLLEDGGMVVAGRVTDPKDGAPGDRPDSYVSRAYVARLSLGDGTAEVSTPLLYAPVLAVPLYLLVRRKRAA